MNEALPYIFTVVLIVLSVILSIIGVQLISILFQVKKTISRVNDALDNVESKFNKIVEPLQNLKGLTSGITAGVEILKVVVDKFTAKKKHSKD